MAICETCGKKYAPTKQAPGCPHCAAGEASPEPAAPAKAPRPPRAVARGASAAGPARAPARARQVAAEVDEPEADDVAPGPEGMLDQSSKIGLIAAGGLALVVLLVTFFVMRKKAEETRVREAYQHEVKELYTQLTTINTDDEAQAKRLLQLAKDKENRWKNHELAPQIQLLVSRAAASLETGKERRESLGRFTEIEKQLEDPSKLTPETLNGLRRGLTELEAKISLGGDEYLKRYATAKTNADRAYVTRLLENAQEAAQAKSVSPRPALILSQGAEDEIKKLLDQAYLEKNQELQDFYTALYKKTIDQSDQLALALFTDKNTEDLPWTDCLSGEQAGLWNASKAKGFSHRVENGVLQIIGPDADAGRLALISIGDKEQWRNLVLEIEFTLEKGNVELFLRLGRSANANTISYPFETEGDNALMKSGRTYKATMRLLGSQFATRFTTDDLDTPPPREDKVTWAKGRRGALGFMVPPGARLKVTTFKVRELR